MTSPPEITTKLIGSAEEMERLFRDNSFDEKLKTCDPLRFPEPQDIYHETFCCKRELVRYINTGGVEIALITYQTDSLGNASRNQRLIRNLLIGETLCVRHF